MTNRTAATRYARALFDVSVQDHDLQRVESGLAGLLAMIDGHETPAGCCSTPPFRPPASGRS